LQYKKLILQIVIRGSKKATKESKPNVSHNLTKYPNTETA